MQMVLHENIKQNLYRKKIIIIISKRKIWGDNDNNIITTHYIINLSIINKLINNHYLFLFVKASKPKILISYK